MTDDSALHEIPCLYIYTSITKLGNLQSIGLSQESTIAPQLCYVAYTSMHAKQCMELIIQAYPVFMYACKGTVFVFTCSETLYVRIYVYLLIHLFIHSFRPYIAPSSPLYVYYSEALPTTV